MDYNLVMSRKRTIIICLTAIVLFIIFLSSCTQLSQAKEYFVDKFSGDKEMGEALQVTESFFDALIEKDYESAYSLITTEGRKSHNFKAFQEEFINVIDIISYEINWVEVKNNIAIVCIDFMDSYDGEEKIYKDKEVSLVKEEDIWKVKFWK